MGKYYQQEIECASREEIKKMQSERLVKTVKRAYENSAYYKKLMDEKGLTPQDVKSVDDLHKLPFIKKDDLRRRIPTGCSRLRSLNACVCTLPAALPVKG